MDTLPDKPEAVSSQIPAPSSKNHAQPPPGKQPRELKPWQVWFTVLTLPVFFSMFLCAVLGLFVLIGGELAASIVSHSSLPRSAPDASAMHLALSCRSEANHLAWTKLLWDAVAQTHRLQSSIQCCLPEWRFTRYIQQYHNHVLCWKPTCDICSVSRHCHSMRTAEGASNCQAGRH